MSKDEQAFPEDSWSQDEPTAGEPIKWAPAVNVASKWWKSGLAFSKMAPMPSKWWKRELPGSHIASMPWKAPKEKKPPKPLKRTPLPPPTKPIAKIGKRKKERISLYGTESDFFFCVWEYNGWLVKDIICSCWCKKKVVKPFIQDEKTGKWKLVKPQCFSHKLSKGLYERFRYLKENISIVATKECHDRKDKELIDQVKRNELEAELDMILNGLSEKE